MLFVRKFIILICFIFFMSVSAYSYNSLQLGVGPGLSIYGPKSSIIMFHSDWIPRKYIGTRLYIGFKDGGWLGTALTLNYFTSDKYSRKFHWKAEFSIPFLLHFTSNERAALLGASIGNSFDYVIGKNGNLFLFITPLEVFFAPVTFVFYPDSLILKELRIFYNFYVGLRMRI